MAQTYVRGEIGTSGEFEDIEFDPTDDSSVRSAIAFAVEMEHPCNETHCDIAQALEAGFVYASAHLLRGATETPFLDAVCEAANVSAIDWPEEWDEWVAYHREHTWKCPKCEAYVSEDDDTCGNCLYVK